DGIRDYKVTGVQTCAFRSLPCRFAARAIVTTVVGVVAVEDHRDAAIAGDAGQRRVELVLAVITAIDGVGAVLRTLELRRVNHLRSEERRVGKEGRSREAWC